MGRLIDALKYQKLRPRRISSGANFRYDRTCAVVAGGSASDYQFEGRDMLITLPLALIGIGLLVYLLFVAATYAAPVYAGLLAGFAALHGGTSYTTAFLLGATAFLLVMMGGKIAAQVLPSRVAKVVVLLLFAVPAGVAGFQVAFALLHLSGADDWSVALSLIAALATGIVAASRYRTVAHA